MNELPAPQKIRFETQSFVVRTAEPEDVTPRWAAWLADPANTRMMNAKPMTLSVEDIRRYLLTFDHVKSHILGVFDRGSGELIGFWEIYVDWKHREFQLNVLIGEHGDASLQPRRETQRMLLPYFFNELGLETMRCSVLAENSRVNAMFAARGMVHEHTSRNPSASGGEPVEIYHYRLARDRWRAMRAARLAREAGEQAARA
jgi:RimJ/RimL family protein N-acetyltransferase